MPGRRTKGRPKAETPSALSHPVHSFRPARARPLFPVRSAGPGGGSREKVEGGGREEAGGGGEAGLRRKRLRARPGPGLQLSNITVKFPPLAAIPRSAKAPFGCKQSRGRQKKTTPQGSN